MLIKELLGLLEAVKFTAGDVEDAGDDVVVIVKASDGREFKVTFPEDLTELTVTGSKFAPNEETQIRSVAELAIERG